MNAQKIRIQWLCLMAFVVIMDSTLLLAQSPFQNIGMPVLRVYSPREYKAHNQNWAITKDHRGILYFGNSNGLLEYDGQRWKLIPVNNSIVRSLATDENGIIYAGSADDFGYLKREKNGELQYQSLLNKFQFQGTVGHIWSTLAFQKKIFFVAEKQIFIVDQSGSSTRYIVYPAPSRFFTPHIAAGRLFITDAEEGLLEYKGDNFVPVQHGESLTTRVYSMIPLDPEGKRILTATRRFKLQILTADQLAPYTTEADSFFSKHDLYISDIQLPDGNLVLNTTNGGVIILTREGKILRHLDTEQGLPDNGILTMFFSENTLWLGTQNGIASLLYPSPVLFFDSRSGLQGSVSDFRVYNTNLYAATTSGLQVLKPSTSNRNTRFNRLSFLGQEAWSITKSGEDILGAFTDGVFIIRNGSAERVNSEWKHAYYCIASKKFPNRVYVGLQEGFAIIERSGNTWIDRGKIRGITTAVRFIDEEDDGTIWLGTSYSGVYKITNVGETVPGTMKTSHYFRSKGLSGDDIKIFRTTKGMVFATKTEILRYQQQTDSFIPDTDLRLNERFGKVELQSLFQDKQGIIWVALNLGNKITLYYGRTNKEGTYTWQELSILKHIIDFSNTNAVFSIYKDNNTGIVWFSGADGIAGLVSEYIQNPALFRGSSDAFIRRVSIDRDSLLFFGDDIVKVDAGYQGTISVPSSVSMMRFEFGSNHYDGQLTEFQFMLEGLDEEWSEWTTENRKDYTSLPAGNYTFRLKAKNIHNITGSESSFSFTVLSPWYLSWYAFIIYAALAIIIIIAISRIRFAYLTQKNLRLEAIIADRTTVIRSQADKLKELDALKTRFFTNISHEFRTPLTLTLGQIEAVMEKVQESSIKRKLEMGHRNAKRLLKLINQILEIARIETGNQKLKVQKINITKAARRIFNSFESIADKRGITLRFQQDDEQLYLYADYEKTEMILINLINNALKFTAEGGIITLTVTEKKELSLEERELIEISVHDTGIGIPQDRIPFIFDRFYQVDRAENADTEGTGIGLSLVKELTELHHGTISVSSKPGEGTLFKLQFLKGCGHFPELREESVLESEIDHEPAEQLATSRHDESESDTREDHFNRDSILIIDDNEDIRTFIREQLEDTYLVHEASNGTEGLKTALESIPTLVITDIRMPGMDGYEVSRRLKTDPLTSHIPVIILTAKADEKDKITGLETGADDYLSKPFSPYELSIRVKNLIQNRKKVQESFTKQLALGTQDLPVVTLDQQFLKKVIEIIESHIEEEEFSAKVLAKEAAISVSQLNRKLHAIIGRPAGQLIRNIRMEKAAALIKTKSVPLKEIAFKVGFGDQSNFSRAFRQYYGVSPSEYSEEP